MTNSIRIIEEQDFPVVAKLYGSQKSIEEIKWLFRDYENSDNYNAYVAIDSDNEVVGVIGFSPSVYKQGLEELNGVIFMSWIVAPDYKGLAGILLLKKISLLGDFAIAMSGTKLGQSFYPMLKYQHFSDIDMYYKVLNLPNFFNTLQRSSLKKKLGMFGYLSPTFFKNLSKKYIDKTIEFTKYNGNNFAEEENHTKVFRKVITKNYIDWLLECPKLNTYAFCLKRKDKDIGVCVLYIQKTKNGNKGRIVHLPFLGDNNTLWLSIIEKCLDFFREKNCSYVTGLAHNPKNQSAYSKSGFFKIKQHHKPVYLKDLNNKLKSIDLKNWYLQFSEGDKAYRDL